MELPTIQTGRDRSHSSSSQTPIHRRHVRKVSNVVYVPPADDGLDKERTCKPPVSPSMVAKGAGALAGAQALTKLVSFVLNQLLLRVLSSSELGASSQMELVSATALSLSRDAIRFAMTRETLNSKVPDQYRTDGGVVHGTKSGTMQEAVNLGSVPLLLGTPVILIFTAWSWVGGSPMTRAAALIYALSVAIELASEPFFLLNQLELGFPLRARVESLAAVLRCCVTFLLILFGQAPSLAFALGQLAYSIGIYASYLVSSLKTYHYAAFKLYYKKVWDSVGNSKLSFDPTIAGVATGMYLQSIFKYFLTESDRILVSFMLTLDKQGEYAVASNYGSLLARLVLFPIEEALRSVFAKCLSPTPGPEKAEPEEPELLSPMSPIPGSPKLPGSPMVLQTRFRSNSLRKDQVNSPIATSFPAYPQEKPSDPQMALTVLTTTLRLYTYVGLAAISVGYYIAPFVLKLMLSDKWSQTEAPKVLAAYICYIPVLAWNGALETIVQSVATNDDLKRQSKVMLALAVLFLAESWVCMKLLDLGACGLVYAQTLNMILRSLWSLDYARNYFKDQGPWLAKTVPKYRVWVVGALVIASAHFVGTIHSFGQLLIQVLLGLVLLVPIVWDERQHLHFILARIRPRQPKAANAADTKAQPTRNVHPSAGSNKFPEIKFPEIQKFPDIPRTPSQRRNS